MIYKLFVMKCVACFSSFFFSLLPLHHIIIYVERSLICEDFQPSSFFLGFFSFSLTHTLPFLYIVIKDPRRTALKAFSFPFLLLPCILIFTLPPHLGALVYHFFRLVLFSWLVSPLKMMFVLPSPQLDMCCARRLSLLSRVGRFFFFLKKAQAQENP